MLIRLTTPEAFDRLVDYLERERGLVWPEVLKDGKNTFPAWFREFAKVAIKKDTVFVDVTFDYDCEKRRMVSHMTYMTMSDIDTDEQYLKEHENENE